jgi:hypothetical protein
MTNPARNDLPVEIIDALESVGLAPEVSALMRLIADFQSTKAHQLAPPGEPQQSAANDLWPLKAITPLGTSYESARRAVIAGRLKAQQIGGRWFCTKTEMQRWSVTTRRGQRKP